MSEIKRSSKASLKDEIYSIGIRDGKLNYILMLALSILYKVFLDIMFVTSIKGGDSMYNGDIDGGKVFLGFILHISLACLLPRVKDYIFSTFINLEFIITIAPVFCVMGFSGRSLRYSVMVWLCMLLQIYLLGDGYKPGYVKGISVKIGKSYVIVLSTILAFFCILVAVFVNNGFAAISAFDFGNVYSVRINWEYPSILYYAFLWCQNILVPFLIVYSIYEKKILAAGLYVILEIFIFMSSGAVKFVLLIIPIVVGMCFLAKERIVFGGTYIVFILGCIITIYGKWFLPEKIMGYIRLFGYRFLTYPAIIKFKTYEVFSQFPKVGYGEGLIGKIFSLSNLYKYHIGRTVNAYLKKAEVTFGESNSGYLSESYAQLGFVGMVLMTFLLVFLLQLLKKVSNNIDSQIMIPMITILVITLNDEALFTMILSYGLGILLIVCACFNKRKEI